MKHFNHFLLTLSIGCLVAGEASAQFKFRSGGSSNKGGSSQRSSNNSRRFSTGNSNRMKQQTPSLSNKGNSGSNQSGNLSRFQKSLPKTKLGNNGNSNLSRFTPKGNSQNSGQNNLLKSRTGSLNKGSLNKGSLNKGSLNKGRTLLNGLKKTSQNSNGNSLTKLSPKSVKPLDSWLGKKKLTTLPFNPGNNNGVQSNGSGSSSNKKAWHVAVQKIMHHNKRHWCHTRPRTCHWWASYCQPIAHCHHNEVITCDWNRVHCSTVLHVGTPPQNVQWYLGMKGILLPGKGLGVEAVEPNSPAAACGLQPGMVITVCNGIPLLDEGSLQESIRISGGVLYMTLLSQDGSQVLEGTVQMARVAAVSF